LGLWSRLYFWDRCWGRLWSFQILKGDLGMACLLYMGGFKQAWVFHFWACGIGWLGSLNVQKERLREEKSRFLFPSYKHSLKWRRKIGMRWYWLFLCKVFSLALSRKKLFWKLISLFLNVDLGLKGFQRCQKPLKLNFLNPNTLLRSFQ
jgi:hypothetical protein